MNVVRLSALQVTLLVFLGSQSSMAHGSIARAIAAGVADSILDCYQITSGDQRILCYDEIAASLSAAPPPAVNSTDETAALPVPQAAAEPPVDMQKNTIEAEDLFGRNNQSTQALVAEQYDIQAIEELRSRASKVEKVGYGTYRITLDNGQIWKQKGSGSTMTIKVGQMLVIKPAAMKSFRLFVEDKHRSIRVERIF